MTDRVPEHPERLLLQALREVPEASTQVLMTGSPEGNATNFLADESNSRSGSSLADAVAPRFGATRQNCVFFSAS